MNHMTQLVEVLRAYSGIATILLFFILTWRRCLRGAFIIDDDQGVQQFSDKFRPELREPNGTIVSELLVDYYNQDVGRDENGKPITKQYKNRQYNPHLGFPGAFMRWHRLHIGKKFSTIGKNKKGHEVYGFIQDPSRHHLWSMVWYALCLILCYRFLGQQFGEAVAFPATLLFAVHPIISQSVCWISGINYVYCLAFLLLNYNLLGLELSYFWTIPLTLLCTFLSAQTLLVGSFNFAVLYILGYHWEAFAAFILACLMLFKYGIEVVSYRRKEFIKQNMTASITPNIRKPIVMLRTLWYYLCMVVLPKRLGLYHEFGYHYDRKQEEPDHMFWLGLLSLLGMLVTLIYAPLIFKFCVVWFLAYFLIFSNFLTANQFVVERYIFIPSLAYCVVFAYFLYPYPQLFWLLIGLYAMRSALHVWTFDNQVSFYRSNIMNFPKSEVAYGNLGCAHQGLGESGTAFDLWMKATKINPHYDVPWYNMHSLMKTSGQLEQSKEYLTKCMDAKIVHFKATWEKEMDDLNKAIAKKQAFEAMNKEMNDAINAGHGDLVADIKKRMDILMQPTTVVQAAPKSQ